MAIVSVVQVGYLRRVDYILRH